MTANDALPYSPSYCCGSKCGYLGEVIGLPVG